MAVSTCTLVQLEHIIDRHHRANSGGSRAWPPLCPRAAWCSGVLWDANLSADVYGGKLFEEKCNATASRRSSQLVVRNQDRVARVHRAFSHMTKKRNRPARYARVQMMLAASWRDAVCCGQSLRMIYFCLLSDGKRVFLPYLLRFPTSSADAPI